MIPSNFYNAPYSYGCGVTENQYTDSYTNTINSISGFMDTMCSAYWLGYISYDNLPMAFKHSMATYDDTNGFVFEEDTNRDNFPCGYCVGNQSAGYALYGTPEFEVNAAYEEDGILNPTYCHIRLFNSLHPEYSGYGNLTNNNPKIIVQCYLFDPAENYINLYDITMGFSNYLDFYNFLIGDYTYTIDVQGHPVNVTADDFETGTCYKETTDNYYVRIFIVNYCFTFRRVQNGSYVDPTVLPAFMVQIAYGEQFTLLFGNQGTCQLTGAVARFYNNNVQWAKNWWSTYGGSRAGLSGTISQEAFNNLISISYNYWYVYDNNVLLQKRPGNDYYFYCIYPIADILKHFSLMYRVDLSENGITTSYVFGLSYATNVTENNEFTATLKTGNITNQEFKNSLRQWQYSDIANNDFTENDIPPYTPEPDDETDSGGDDILPPDTTNFLVGNPNNFVTLYGMTAATLSDMGKKLWAALSDPAYWEMVGTAFLNDFSINPADMMKYFISLRFYPFDLDNIPHSLSVGVYLGRATAALSPSVGVEYPILISKCITQLNGGSVSVPHFYNDFRDYSPYTSVSVYVPFCGSVELPANEVMGHTLNLVYQIDLQTGAMVGIITVSSNTVYVIATVAGSCGASIPITANNNMEFLQRIATVGFDTIGGGISGAVKGGNIGGEVGAVAGAIVGTVAGGVSSLAGLPPVTVHKYGNASGFANICTTSRAYITIVRQKFEIPRNYGHDIGYATQFTNYIGALHGRTVCENVDTTGLSCNSKQRAEIKRLLESGIYV